MPHFRYNKNQDCTIPPGMIERFNRTLLNMLNIANEENPHNLDMIVVF